MAGRDLYDNPWPGSDRFAGPSVPRAKSPTETVNTTTTNPWKSTRRASTSYSRPEHSPSLSHSSSSSSFAEIDALGDGEFAHRRFLARPIEYRQGGTIDWQHEEAAELARLDTLKKNGHSAIISRISSSVVEGTRVWLVLGLTGLGVGLIGAWLDILVAWLSDLRTGRCTYGFFYNEVACCSGLNAGEVCTEWQSWSSFLNIRSWFLGGALHWIAYVFLAIGFATSAAVLVRSYAPYAFHTGIPEIKAILGGYVFDAFLTPWTLVIKSLGLALAVAAGLSLGKEGPLVHVSCCLALLLMGMFKSLRQNEAQKRYILAAAAAAGVSVAFGSPLGAVIFGLEELDLFHHRPVIWRAFVTSAIAAVSLQYVDPFGTSKLVLFQVTSNTLWRDFELIPWSLLAVAGGVTGSMLIKLNVRAAIYRKQSGIGEWPLLEVAIVSAITGIVSYPLVFLRVQSSVLVADLFQECTPSTNFYGLCDPDSTLRNVFLLLFTAAIKLLLTAWTFGMQVPAGIFLPSITIGATMGRAVGLVMHAMHQKWPMLWIFNTCPPEPGSRCIFPGFYSVVGAAAMLGGVTRMTVSLVVIIFELTGALSHVLPIMISVVISKFVGDALGKQGIYAAWIQLRGYPALPNDEYRDHGKTAASVMVPARRLVCVNATSSLLELDAVLTTHQFYGFPVVDNKMLVGYVTHEQLKTAIGPLLEEEQNSSIPAQCTLVPRPEGFAGADISEVVDASPMQMRKEMPLELVTSTFQKMNLRCILFTSRGQLAGLLTKRDIVNIMSSGKFQGSLQS